MEGVLNVSKPLGPTSFSVVESVRKIVGVEKAGHIGTLDPSATGVLPICLNRSTKISQFLTGLDKEYRATMTLGIETDSQDGQGKIISKSDPSWVKENDIKKTFTEFTGIISQTPPMFSAKKRKGIPLYKLARNGITVKRKPFSINIISMDLIYKKGNEIEFITHCSSGTYIRTLCHDVGQRLGCGAHLKNLIRTRVGSFKLSHSVTLEDLKLAVHKKNLDEILITPRDVLNFFPEATVKEPYIEAVMHGKPLSKSYFKAFPQQFRYGMKVRISSSDHILLAIAESLADQEAFDKMTPEDILFKLKRVFN